MALAIWQTVQVMIPYASAYGPGTSYGDVQTRSHAALVRDRFCWNEGEVDDRLALLATDWLPQMFGARAEPIVKVGVISTRRQGIAGLWVLLASATMFAAGRLVQVRWRRRRSPGVDRVGDWRFGEYLVVTGVVSAVTYAVMCGQRSHLTMRYMLLALLVPVGISALYLVSEPRRALRIGYGAVLGFWAGVSVTAHAALLHEYVTATPPDHYRALVTHLERAGVTSGSAGFWDAYAVTFLSQGLVRLASFDLVRIDEYQAGADAPGAVRVATGPCEGEQVARWWVCR
jgi:hypothetical protein